MGKHLLTALNTAQYCQVWRHRTMVSHSRENRQFVHIINHNENLGARENVNNFKWNILYVFIRSTPVSIVCDVVLATTTKIALSIQSNCKYYSISRIHLFRFFAPWKFRRVNDSAKRHRQSAPLEAAQHCNTRISLNACLHLRGKF